MIDQANKNQNQAVDEEWQPDQAIVFNQAEEQEQPLKKTQEPLLAQTNKATWDTDQLRSLQNITSRLDILTNELKQLLQNSTKSLAARSKIASPTKQSVSESEPVIEGYFDGEQMIAANGQVYAVPANYASKSKLVEGDGLKLTIGNHGHFIYKQINVIDRRRLVANLEQAPDGNYYAVYEHQRWRLLKASVSYFRAQPGDRIAILIPQDIAANFAALENLVAE